MTEERKDELLEKILKVVNNDTTAFAGVERDIRVVKDSKSGDIVIDMVAHFIKTDENEPDRMNVSYACAKSVIKNASRA